MAKRIQKGRFNFIIDSSIYDEFSGICDEEGLVRSKQVELMMKKFIAGRKA